MLRRKESMVESGVCLCDMFSGLSFLGLGYLECYTFRKLALTSPTSGGRSIGKVRLRTQAMNFLILFVCCSYYADMRLIVGIVLVSCRFVVSGVRLLFNAN
jgi:hypothetical protein